LLGCGDVAQRDYLPEMYRLADRVELVAVCGRSEDRARRVAKEYGVTAWYTDYARMLQESNADAVINLTPIPLHAQTTLMALEAEKHVYSEKPAATSVADAQRLRQAAVDRGIVLVCAPSVLLFPQIRELRRLLEQDMIGSVHSMIGQGFGGVPPWQGYTSDPSPFFAAGAGPVADMGVYPLHVITGLFGPAQRVSAMAVRAQDQFIVDNGPARGIRVPVEVEDTWHLVLGLGGNRLASVMANNSAVASRAPQLELYGLRGTIAVNILDVAAPILVCDRTGRWEEIPVPHERTRGPDHVLGLAHLVDCVEQRHAPVASIDHALHVIEIIEAAARSATTGTHVELPPSSGRPLSDAMRTKK
jgi:predicted dehydrogenase